MKKEIIVRYSTNNSGGSDWLRVKDWEALEKSGWRTYGFGNFEYDSKGNEILDAEGYPKFIGRKERRIYGYKKFDSIQEALEEFEKLTGQDVSDEGCNCCGAPHNFNWGDNYSSGSDLLQYLYPGKNIPKSIRESIF